MSQVLRQLSSSTLSPFRLHKHENLSEACLHVGAACCSTIHAHMAACEVCMLQYRCWAHRCMWDLHAAVQVMGTSLHVRSACCSAGDGHSAACGRQKRCSRGQRRHTGSDGTVLSLLCGGVLCVDEAALVQAAHACADCFSAADLVCGTCACKSVTRQICCQAMLMI